MRNRVYKREDSRYWWAEYTTPDGIPIRKSTGCTAKARAEEWLAVRTIERIRSDAGIPTAQPYSLLDAAAEYIADREPYWSPGWRDTVKGLFKNHVVPWFGGDTLVSSITRMRVERWRKEQLERSKAATGHRPVKKARKAKKVSPATVNRHMAVLAAFGSWCEDRERRYTLDNPFCDFKPLPENQLATPRLDADELQAFLEAIEDEDLRRRMTFAADTGLRKGELERLRREDIDTRLRRCEVVSSYDRAGKRDTGLTKSRKRRRVILTERCLAILGKVPKRLDGLVFGPSSDHRRAINSACRRAGIKRLRPNHDMRHVSASRLAEAGASLADLLDWGGWSNMRMVQRYTHTDDRRILALVQRMEEAEGIRAKNVQGGCATA